MDTEHSEECPRYVDNDSLRPEVDEEVLRNLGHGLITGETS